MNKVSKEPLRVTYDCIPCAISSLLKLFKNGLVPQQKQENTLRALLNYFSEANFNQSPPAFGQEMHRIIRKTLNDPDPYLKIKKKFNSLMLKHYIKLKNQVTQEQDQFQLALRLSIAGNIIDFGPNHSFNVNDTFKKAKFVKLAVDDSQQLKEACSNADTLLYLGDNAGEIVMDRLFLETINHSNVYFAVRGAPIINDITLEDAKQIGIDKIANIISNGDDAPGTILKNVSPRFREVFDSADLIISKGQGNYEGLSGCGKNIYFVLMAKCEHVASHLGVRNGDFVVKKE